MSHLLKDEEQPREVVLRDGKEYTLVPLDMNLMIEIEDHFEKPLGELFREGWIKHLRYAFWVLLKETYPDMTVEQAGRLITAKVISELQIIFSEMLGIEPEKNPEEDPEKEE